MKAKTLIFKKSELDSLPADVQKQIMSVYNARSNELKELKARIKALPYKLISYREDNGSLDDLREVDGEHLTFRMWEKTDGEQWGNSQGREYEIRIGRKYIRVDGSGWCTNRPDWGNGSFYMSTSKLAEIVDLVEEAMKQEDVYSPDATAVIAIAISRMNNLDDNYQGY